MGRVSPNFGGGDQSTCEVRQDGAPGPGGGGAGGVFTKGDAVLLTGNRRDPSDPGIEGILQIEGGVAETYPTLKIKLQEPVPAQWCGHGNGVGVATWRLDKLSTRVTFERSVGALSRLMKAIVPVPGEQTGQNSTDPAMVALLHSPTEEAARANVTGSFGGCVFTHQPASSNAMTHTQLPCRAVQWRDSVWPTHRLPSHTERA